MWIDDVRDGWVRMGVRGGGGGRKRVGGEEERGWGRKWRSR